MPTTTSVRGRSRLPSSSPKKALTDASSTLHPSTRKSNHLPKIHFSSVLIIDWLQHHVLFIGTTIATVSVGILLFTTVSPSKVANIGLPETFVPLLILVGVFAFSVSRLLLSRRHASYVTVVFVLCTFVHVHHLNVPATFWLVPVGLIACCELFVLLAKTH